MSFVETNDILETFEGLAKHLFKTTKGVEFSENFPRMTYAEAMRLYGCDNPDLRFGMQFVDVTNDVKGRNFKVFDDAEYIAGICAENCAVYTRAQLDELTDFVKKPQVGATGLVYIRYNADGTLKSSVDKFYSPDDLKLIASKFNAKAGDLILLLSGAKTKTQKALCELRLEMGKRLGLRDNTKFAPLWVIDFPLFEWDEETQRFYAMHHPFTSPNKEDIEYMDTDPGRVRANAYDLVINGTEIGGGSIRIHNSELQQKMFKCLGFTKEDAEFKFGFIMNAFKYGAPPHGGIAFGFDRLTALFCGVDSIRDVIAFPKNNAGKDAMLETPSKIDDQQLKDLFLKVV